MNSLRNTIIGTLLVAAGSAQGAFAQTTIITDSKSLERGRYVVKLAGCNDCHTPNFGPSGGKVPEKEWLTGDQLGWRGPWGTTYPTNLRLSMAKLTENQWVALAKSAQFRPPMPWWALHDMTEQDLRAMYKFIRYLGPAGKLAPVFVPPGQEPKGPYVLMPTPPN